MIALLLTLSVLMFLVGLTFQIINRKKDPAQEPQTPAQPAAQQSTGDPKTLDEQPDIWYRFGFADDAPNVIRAVVAGRNSTGTILRYITYKRDWDETNHRFVDIAPDRLYADGSWRYKNEDELSYWIRKLTGKRRYGWPFLNSLKWVTVDRVVEVKTENVHAKIRRPDQDDAPELLDRLAASRVKRSGLYERIIRPTLHKDVDTNDSKRFTVISFLVVNVIDPRPTFERYPDSFLTHLSEIVSGFISSKVINMTWKDYKAKGSDGRKFANDPNDPTKDELGQLRELLKPLGMEIEQFTMSDPELNPNIQGQFDRRAEADANAETTIINAEAEAEATVKKAEGKRQAREKEGDGDAAYTRKTGLAEAEIIERKATAMAARLGEYFMQYKQRGASDADALAAAHEMLKTQFGAEAVEQFKGSVYAPGNSAGIFVGTGGNQQ